MVIQVIFKIYNIIFLSRCRIYSRNYIIAISKRRMEWTSQKRKIQISVLILKHRMRSHRRLRMLLDHPKTFQMANLSIRTMIQSKKLKNLYNQIKSLTRQLLLEVETQTQDKKRMMILNSKRRSLLIQSLLLQRLKLNSQKLLRPYIIETWQRFRFKSKRRRGMHQTLMTTVTDGMKRVRKS